MTSLNVWEVPEWPFVLGRPSVDGRLRCQPEDFEVEELPLVHPSGQGSHCWLWVEKTGANTDWVAGQLAKAYGCSPRDVGFAGMKDRHAVTRQWFSLPWPKNSGADTVADASAEPGVVSSLLPEDPGIDAGIEAKIEGVCILQTSRHEKKLRRGILRGNRFRILVRQLQGDSEILAAKLNQIKKLGVPNYFGPQRFGFGGANVERAVHWLQHGGRLPHSKRSIYLSALRSFLFNQVLAHRVREGSWNRLLKGELAMLDGTHSIFLCTAVDEVLDQRCSDFDIHPTGPMPGRGGMAAVDSALGLEQNVLAPYADCITSLDRFGVDAERRSLRLRVAELIWEIRQDNLLLEFSLPAGAYATVVLRELINETESTV
jgi:tRNA pseudouridine13 synthase